MVNLRDLALKWKAEAERHKHGAVDSYDVGFRNGLLICAAELELWLDNDFQVMVKEWKAEAEKIDALLVPILKCPHAGEDGRSCSKCGQLLV